MSIKQATAFARAGQTVAWFDMTYRADAFDAIVRELGDDAVRVRRVNGQHSITTEQGGTITFHSVRVPVSVRGHNIDLAILPDWRLIQDDAFMKHLLPSFGSELPRIAVEA